MKLRIHAIYQLEIDFVMAKNTAIHSVANTINKFHIQYELHFIYEPNYYYDKQDEIDTIFDEYHVALLNDLYHTAFIEEWKQNLYAATYEFFFN